MAGFLCFHVAVLVLIWLLPGLVAARSWYVKPDGTGDAPTIRAAIDSAAAGDEVLLASGTYTWTSQGASSPSMIHMKRNVHLRGENGAAATILDAESNGRVIEAVDVDQARIEGITVTRGMVSHENGAGIISSGDSRQTIVNCVAKANEALEFTGGGGGGIACGGGTILRCEILDNRAQTGAGIIIGNGIVSGCTIRGNKATGDPGGFGGGIAAFGPAEISDCLIENNRASGLGSDGGGVYAVGGTSGLRITGCTFIGNFAGSGAGSGGAMYCFENVSISDCVFIGNTATGNPGVGGAITCSSPSQVSITRCTLIRNRGIDLSAPHAVPPVGGIYVIQSGAASVTSVIIASSEGAPCFGTATWSCDDLYGNSLGDGLCGTDAGGNFSADPQFCAADPATTMNFTLQSDSPCAPGNHPDGAACGLIGAAPVGCGSVSVQSMTWSRLKSAYR